MKKRFFAFALLLCLLFCGCGNTLSPDAGTAGADPSANPAAGETDEAQPGPGYAVYDVADSMEFPLNCTDADCFGGVVWLLGRDSLLRCDMVDGETVTLPLEADCDQIAAAPDGVWVLHGTELKKLDAAGKTLASATVSQKSADLVCDAEGLLYASQKSTVAIVDAAGSVSEIETPDGYTPGALTALGGSGAAVFAARLKGEQPSVLCLNGSEKRLEPMKGEALQNPYAFPGSGSGDNYCVNSSRYELLSEGKQVFHVSGGTVSPVFDLAGLGYEGRLRGIFPLNGDFLVVYSTADSTGILRLTRTAQTKKILTMARAETNGELLMLIARFNAQSRDTYIVSKFYDDEGGEQRLLLDFLAGERPDLLSLNGLTPEVFTAKGLLTDLYPLLDAGGSVSRNDLQPGILHILESPDGGLYELCPCYALSTCAVDRQYTGGDGRMTLSELYAADEANPDLTIYGGQRGYIALNFLLSSVFPDFADLGKPELRFDSPEFIRFLELVKKMDENAQRFTGDYSYSDGNVLLCPLTLTAINDYRRILLMDEMRYLEITGFPSDSGTGCLITVPQQIGIVSGTGNEDAAWSFIEYMLSEAEQAETDLLPLRVSSLEAQIAAASGDVPAHSETRYVDPYAAKAGMSMETETVEIPEMKGLTEAEANELRGILDSAAGIYNEQLTNPCFGIVYAECRSLLTGERDAEATAKAIQSKMELYLAERS